MFDLTISNTQVIGWDIGGANVKVAKLNAEGAVLQALQVSCELWRGLEHLEKAIEMVIATFKVMSNEALHVVTMTGELVDLFSNRHTGVLEIAARLNRLLGCDGATIKFYAADKGFVHFNQVSALSMHIASANWHASASALALHLHDGLLVDIGSTTTDIIPIQSGKVNMLSFSDAERMKTDHLIYTGAIRTPVMALGNKIVFEGIETNVAAENFATMADVYRLTGELSQKADMVDTADGQNKSTLASARRLARMIGHDVEDKSLADWKDLALVCRSMQVNQIKSAILKQLKYLKPNTPIIGAGTGSFLVKSLAGELGHAYLPVSQILEKEFDDFQALEVCFPACAVTHLYLHLNQLQFKRKVHA